MVGAGYGNGWLLVLVDGLEIIRVLKKGVKFFYSKHTDISILFSNIYDFDSVASRLDAHSLVTNNQFVIDRFDGGMEGGRDWWMEGSIWWMERWNDESTDGKKGWIE